MADNSLGPLCIDCFLPARLLPSMLAQGWSGVASGEFGSAFLWDRLWLLLSSLCQKEPPGDVMIHNALITVLMVLLVFLICTLPLLVSRYLAHFCLQIWAGCLPVVMAPCGVWWWDTSGIFAAFQFWAAPVWAAGGGLVLLCKLSDQSRGLREHLWNKHPLH